MKKTQQLGHKTSFKTLLNVENDKLPEKKSRSRSIRDRNNTTGTQITISRVTQNNRNQGDKGREERQRGNAFMNNYRSRNEQTGSVMRSDQDKYSNMSKEQSSIQKIKENMRKQSQQFNKEIQRKRSHSRRRNNSRNKSKQNSFSRFPGSLRSQASQKHIETNNQQESNQKNMKSCMNQIIKLKNRVKGVQNRYDDLSRQISHKTAGYGRGSFSLKNVSSSDIYNSEEVQNQLKEKAFDLNNILQTFDITFKENMIRMTRQLTEKVDNYKEQLQKANKINSGSQITSKGQNSNNFDEKQNQKSFQTIINRLETEFNIKSGNIRENGNVNKKQNGPLSGSLNRSVFDIVRQNEKKAFCSFQKKLILAQERLLK